MKKPIYLDHAAATPLSPTVLVAMQPYFSERFYNPSATYLVARSVAQDIAAARHQAAVALGVRAGEIYFTAGGTEANNLAIHGIMRQFPGANVIVSAIEHDSVLVPAAAYSCRIADSKSSGHVDLESLKKRIDDRTVLVSVMYANNELGTIQPLNDVQKILEEIRQKRQRSGNTLPLYFHSDACQAGNYLKLQPHRLGIDLLTLNGGKLYGPKQSGALFVRTGLELEPQILGGGQERGLRSGTENIPAIIGFCKALNEAQEQARDENRRLNDLRNYFVQLLESHLPPDSYVVNGSAPQLPNILHVTFPGQDNERLMMELDERGIQAAVGSACSASTDEPSHVLKAIGLDDAGARASLRFSMGRHTAKPMIDRAVKALADLLV